MLVFRYNVLVDTLLVMLCAIFVSIRVVVCVCDVVSDCGVGADVMCVSVCVFVRYVCHMLISLLSVLSVLLVIMLVILYVVFVLRCVV